jgi:hypothetical protein
MPELAILYTLPSLKKPKMQNTLEIVAEFAFQKC